MATSSDQMGYTLVFYYIPEDYDELSTPNAYAIPKQLNDITLQDIEQLFPLNQPNNKSEESDFHFRFKYRHNGQSVWLDLNNKKVKVPKYDGKIIMKVTRRKAKYTLGNLDTGFSAFV